MIRPSCHHLKGEEVPTDTQETLSNELAQRPANLLDPTAATDSENASAERRWYGRHRSTTDVISAASQL
nr:unnamed protein product [Spirometra erinaceieuropaei]